VCLGVVASSLAAALLVWPFRWIAHLHLGPVQHALGLALLIALGGGLGFTVDRQRRDRELRRALMAAARDLGAAADETAARRALLERLRRLAPGAAFAVLDQAGGVLSAPVPTRRFSAPKGAEEPAQKLRPLQADGRTFGAVRWRQATNADGHARDEVAAAMIDLAAAAILRARLKAEKTEIENVARAEVFRTVMLDAVSHHFRSPLAGILGSVTTILDLPDAHDRGVRSELLLIIKEESNRLARYVENFLSVARLEAGSLEVNRSDVDLASLIDDVWDKLADVGGARRYFQVDLEVDSVCTDPSLLAQIFGNVLENAIKYSPEESLIEVCAHRMEDTLLIEVYDQGRGASETILTRMFDRFYRGGATAESPGIGLGLYITRSLIEMLGGDVSARNRTDGHAGLVIAIRLPLEPVTA
jgi:two-component system sensor histidine kinase KdpD